VISKALLYREEPFVRQLQGFKSQIDDLAPIYGPALHLFVFRHPVSPPNGNHPTRPLGTVQ
jgi:hypothetical protein